MLNKHMIITVLLAFMMTLSTVSSSNSTQEGQVWSHLLNYEGVLMINIVGEDYVREYFNVQEHCNIPIDSISITIRYSVLVNIELDQKGDLLIRDINLSSIQIPLSHSCIDDQLQRNIQHMQRFIRDPGDFYIILELDKDGFNLERVNRTGEIIGVLRFDYDVVHLMRVVGYETSTSYQYDRYILYYEPLTGIPVHVDNVRVELGAKGSVHIVHYVTLSGRYELFKGITRKIYEIVHSDQGINRTAILLLLYHRGEETIEPIVKTQRDEIFIEFNQPTRCFVQLGPISRAINSSIMMISYNVSNNLVYLTPSSILCDRLNISLSSSSDAEIHVKEAESFIERGVPLSIPSPMLSDAISIVALFIILISWFYFIVREIVSRLIK